MYPLTLIHMGDVWGVWSNQGMSGFVIMTEVSKDIFFNLENSKKLKPLREAKSSWLQC